MHRFKILVRGVVTVAAVMAIAACGGGGGSDIGTSEPAFNTVNLATVGGSSFSSAAAINDSSEVVGISDGGLTAPTTMKAVAWTMNTTGSVTTTTITQLALPAGAGGYSAAYGINNSGAIVGELEASPGGAIVAAFWPSRTAAASQVVLLSQGTAAGGAAYGINTAGRIVGELHDGPTPVAATWKDAAAPPVILPAPAGTTAGSAYFVNDSGKVVGELTDAVGTHAALWLPNATTGAFDTDPVLLPAAATLTGDSAALAISTSGNIVGEITDNGGKVHAARWIRQATGAYILEDLGPAGNDSGAAGINDDGRTVGHITSTGAGGSSLATATTWATGQDKASPISAVLDGSQAYAISTTNRVVGSNGPQAFAAIPR